MRRIGFILALIGLTAPGCFGSGTATPAHGGGTPSGRLAVTIKLGLNTQAQITHRYSLTCDPAGGTMLRPGAACHAITNDLHQSGPTVACVGDGAPPTATAALVGTFAHKPFRLTLDTASWCGQSMQVMRDYWTLSTFPCSTIVLHTTNISSYADWATASGCSTAVGVVPKVTPTYVQDAESAIRAVGLRVEIASVPGVTDADAAVNGYAVSGQSPRAGTHVPSGTLVVLRLVVSFNLGPGGVGEPGTVPNLIGLPINSAMEAATSVGLHVTVPAVTHPIANDAVTAQSIPAGSRVKRDSIISLTLG